VKETVAVALHLLLEQKHVILLYAELALVARISECKVAVAAPLAVPEAILVFLHLFNTLRELNESHLL